jgi:hypothetical protein
MPIAAVVLLRMLQLVCLTGIWIGLTQLPALITIVSEAIQQHAWTWPSICAKLAAVTGPVFVACLVIALLETVIGQLSRRRKALATNASQPWLANPMWAAQHIKLSSRPVWIGLWIFLAFYISVLLPLAVASQKQPLLIIWAVVGLVALVFMRLLWIGRKWGNAELKIATLPGVIGGPLSGVAIIHHRFADSVIFDVNLRCTQAVETGTRKERRVQWVDRWTSTQFIEKTLDGVQPGSTAIPIDFAIPYDALPTNPEGKSPVQWMLTVSEKAEINMGGATFEVPVFKTAQSSANYKPDRHLIEKFLHKLDPVNVLRRYNMQRTSRGNQQVFEFSDYNHSIFVTIMVMTLILIGVEVGLWYGIKDFNKFLFIGAFPGFFLAIFIYGIVRMLFWRCHIVVTSQANTSPQDFVEELKSQPPTPALIEATAGILGFRKSLTVSADRSTKVICKLDHAVNNKEQWSVCLTSEGEQPLKLVSTLEGPEAKVVAAWLAEQLMIGHRRVKADDGFL